MQLPEPHPDALAASQQLQQLIATEIAQRAGWMPFSRFMELALYAPVLGYYSGGAQKLGRDGDFTTAPEITPLFGAALARVAADLMTQTTPQIMEFGAGSGRLAFDILTELGAMGVRLEQYTILDLSGELRARQEHLLRDFPQVVWQQQMPPAYSGLVLGNEVLDAMPVELVVKTATGWQQRGVGATDNGFGWIDRPCGMEASALVAQIPQADMLPVGYLTEVHPAAQGFMHSLADMLLAGRNLHGRGGAAIFIDYGFPAAEFYLDQRTQGTLMCHYRHHTHPEPFYLPGLQDITAHVDFTAMAQAALDGGLELLAYTSQAGFLMAAGIGELLLRTPPTDPMRYLPQANAVQKLISPAEMGELFKVLVVGKDVELAPALLRNDRSHRL
ncbi:class I SAM-dependent methyltransferase [Herminiimonas sp. CN]|uniref:class I SAM-dependent methyltransferase n=1 Tax=Herminiimonas sp. CN TaxID=1349818 RepID=UPI0004738503|nr:SAM-dependent methyltransferase [Herminiimonas sp. CN]